MTKVFAWPPVGVVGAEWTEDAPVSVSRSLITGARRVSTGQRKRRLARLDVSALAAGQMGAGYIEALKRMLEGGIHLVRLYSTPINWHQDVAGDQRFRQGGFFAWETAGNPLGWTTDGDPLAWFTGANLSGTIGTAGGFPSLTVAGLPPGALVARPGEFVTVFDSALPDSASATIMVMTPAFADDDGVAVLRLLTVAPYAVRVSIGTQETGAFEVVNFPRATQPVSGDWRYTFDFREVFANEEADGFTEVNPWN